VSGTGSAEDAFSGWSPEELPKTEAARQRALFALERARRARTSSDQRPSPVSRLGDQREARRVFRELVAAGVPEQYRAPKWDLCQQRDTLKVWCSGIQHKLNRGKGLVLLGDMGTGKSFAAALIAHEAIRAHKHVRWTYAPELLNKLEDRSVRQTVLNQQIGADLVIWDDFGVRDPADWEVEKLDEIVEGRYAARRSLIVTSNWTRERFAADKRLGRMMDRWKERQGLVYFVGESQRRADVESVPVQDTLM
jgi:DNA replication protein DnaC